MVSVKTPLMCFLTSSWSTDQFVDSTQLQYLIFPMAIPCGCIQFTCVLQNMYYFFVQEYLLGDHNQSMLPVAFSLMASFMSAITLLGVSSEVYMYSTLFFIINFGYVIFTPIAAYLFLPVFFKLQATSAYEVNVHFCKVYLVK